MEGEARLAVEDLGGETDVEADGVEIEVRRGVEQDVILRGRESNELARREGDDALADAEGSGAADDEVELRFSVEVARAAPAYGLRILPHEGAVLAGGEEGLVDRSQRRDGHAGNVLHSGRRCHAVVDDAAGTAADCAQRGFPQEMRTWGGRDRYIEYVPGRRCEFEQLIMRNVLKTLSFLALALCPQRALAVSSAELYTAEAYGYGRVEARVQYAPGDGVVSAFFSWKDGSEKAGTFWNELDFEKLGAECRLETNPIYGNPSANHSQKHLLKLDMCGAFHTYAYEWTPEAIVWLVDGMEIRREVGVVPQAYAENASAGMQIRFNLWPGDATFGGNFDPAILPVHEYVDWVQFSKYEGGMFKLAWREDFDSATLPARWQTGSWPSPKNKSTHVPANVNFIGGYAVLSLTADDALGPAGAMPGAAVGGAAGAGGPSGLGGARAVGAAGAIATTGGSASATRSMNDGCSFGSASAPNALFLSLAAAAFGWLQRRARRSPIRQ